MSKFSPADIDALLDKKAPQCPAASVPDDFFATMEQRIIDATINAEAATPNTATRTPEAEVAAAPRIVALKPFRRQRTKWLAAAAAVALVLVSVLSVKYGHRIVTNASDAGDIYAVTEGMTENDIDNLDELFEADVFLEEL